MEKVKATRSVIHAKIQLWSCLCIGFLLPLAQYVSVFIVLLMLNFLLEGELKTKIIAVSKNGIALLFISFYLLFLIGLIYTQNMHSGLFDVQIKLSILLFPIIFSAKPTNEFDKQKIIAAFVLGCFSASALMILRATHTFFTTGENIFFYEAFASFIIHPSYISMYINLAIIWMLQGNAKNIFQEKKLAKIIGALSVFYFTIIVVLLSSKLGIISLLLIYLFFGIRYIIQTKKIKMLGIAIVGVWVVSFVIIKYIPEVNERFKNAINAVNESQPDKTNAESSAVRLLVWEAATTIIHENIFIGVGTGDVKDELMKKYQQLGYTGAYKHKLNAHNQFLQTGIALGIIGILFLIMTLVLPAYISWQQNNYFYVCLIVLLSFNFLTESMLETQSGVMFYAFLSSLLFFRKNEDIEIHNH